VEQVDVPEAGGGQQVLPEGTKVGTVAEAAGGNGYQLAAGLEQLDGCREETGVEIARFNADAPQERARVGGGRDFFVVWVQDREIESRRVGRGRRAGIQPLDRRAEVIRLEDAAGESNAGAPAGGAAEIESDPCRACELRIQFVGCDLDLP